MNTNEEYNIQDKIDSYLNDTMSVSQRLIFEQRMDQDPKLKEQVIVQKSIGEFVFNKDFPLLKDPWVEQQYREVKKNLNTEVYQIHERNIKEVSSTYIKKIRKRKSLFYGSVAAAILILITISIFPRQDSFEKLYVEYADWDEITSYREQNDVKNQFLAGEELYKKRKFTEAIEIFKDYTDDKTNHLYTAGLIYLGASYFANYNYDEAISTYDELVESDSYDSSKGYWYQLLIYLKQKDEKQVNKTVNIILKNPNNYKYDMVREMRESL